MTLEDRVFKLLDQIENEIKNEPTVSEETEEKIRTKLAEISVQLEAKEGMKMKNPLLIPEVFDEVQKYLYFFGNDAHSTLKSARSVCKPWNKAIGYNLRSMSIIAAPEGQSDLSMLLERFPLTLGPDQDIEDYPIYLRIDKQTWVDDERFLQWTDEYGCRLIGLQIISIKKDLRWLGDLLRRISNSQQQRPVTSLQEIVLVNLLTEEIDISTLSYVKIIRSAWGDLPCLRNVKRFIVIATNSNQIWLAIELISRLKSLESLTLLLNLPSDTSALQNAIELMQRMIINWSVLETLIRLELVVDPRETDHFLHEVFLWPLYRLRELFIDLGRLDDIPRFICLLQHTLEKLEIITTAQSKTRPLLLNAIIFPQLLKLKEFTLLYNHYQHPLLPESNKNIIISAGSFISMFPVLKIWRGSELTQYWNNSRSKYVTKVFETQLVQPICCANASCTDVELILATGLNSPTPTHHNLEELYLSCSLRQPHLLLHLSKIFPNLKVISTWIHFSEKDDLGVYLINLVTLKKLQRVTIQLSQSVTNLHQVLNPSLPLLLELKEFTLEKVSKGWKSEFTWPPVELSNLNKIHPGLCGCNNLEIISFKSLKIDPMELEDLVQKIKEDKPRLAINAIDSVN